MLDRQGEEASMRHHVVYWKMARREADVDDVELASLREQERRRELYIEFLNGERRPLDWDARTGRWHVARPVPEPAAA